jgi:acetyl esterase/lipase
VSGLEFLAYVPFFPDCSTTYLTDVDVDVADRPIRIFHGTPDPVAPCRVYVERLRGAGRDIRSTEFPNAHHAFDSPLGSLTPTFVLTIKPCDVVSSRKSHKET